MVTNKTAQDAVRGFGQGPTNLAIERAIDEVADALGLDPLEVRRRNMIRAEEFPYLSPAAPIRQRRLPAVIDKVLAARARSAERERDALRAEGRLAGIGIAACLEPSGGNALFETLLNPKIATSTFLDSCRVPSTAPAPSRRR